MTPPDRDRTPLFQLPGLGGLTSDRGRVINAAAGIVTYDGDHTLPWALVAERSGVSEAEVRRLFPSEDALISATMSLTDSQIFADHFDAEAGRGWTGLDNYAPLLKAASDQPGSIKVYSRFRWDALDPNHPAHEWLGQHRDLNYGVLQRAVRTGVEDGDMAPEIDAIQVSETMMGIAEGVQLQWLASGGKVDIADALRDYVRLLKGAYATDQYKARQAAQG